MARFDASKPIGSSGVKYPELKPGVFEGRILRVIDLGVRRPDPKYPNSRPKTALSIIIEIPDQTMEFEGKTVPRVAFYKVPVAGKKQSGENSRFTGLLEAAGITGEFDLDALLGTPLSVTLAKNPDNGKTFVSGVAGVSARVAGTIPPLVADSYAFDFESPDQEILTKKLSNFMRTQLKEALNYAGSEVQRILENTETQETSDTEEETQDTDPGM